MDKEYFDLNQFNNNYIGKKNLIKILGLVWWNVLLRLPATQEAEAGG
jgi:hypothetical protein